MKHTITTVLVTLFLLGAGISYAATYGWSGAGGDNLWSNGNNWTNVADGSTGTAPGAGDTAIFPQGTSAAIALTADTSINNLVLGTGGMSITGAYTLTLTATNQTLGFGSYNGGSATIDCNISMPNLAAGTTTRIVNYNNQLTINGNVALPATSAGFRLDIWGSGSGVAKFNGQLTGYEASQDIRSFYGNNGTVELGTQNSGSQLHDLMIRRDTLILKGSYLAPLQNGQRVGFPSWDGNTPKKIWIAAEGGLGIYSNQFSFSARGTSGAGQDSKYHEFRVKSPTKHAQLLGRVRIDDKLWWFVDPDCYVEILPGANNVGGIEKADNSTLHGVYMSGGGTTDVKVAQVGGFPIPFFVSNGVLLVNNTSGYALHGPITVHAGGVFGGAGFVGSVVTNTSGGVISPGNSIGTLTVSNAVLQAGSIVDWEVNGTTADKLAVLNNLDISAGIVTVRVFGTTTSSATNSLFSFASLNGSSANLVLDLSQSWLSGGSFVTEGNQILITGLVPEPAVAGALLLAGMLLRKRG